MRTFIVTGNHITTRQTKDYINYIKTKSEINEA